jgi:integral membrane sensor domain MASE1
LPYFPREWLAVELWCALAPLRDFDAVVVPFGAVVTFCEVAFFAAVVVANDTAAHVSTSANGRTESIALQVQNII